MRGYCACRNGIRWIPRAQRLRSANRAGTIRPRWKSDSWENELELGGNNGGGQGKGVSGRRIDQERRNGREEGHLRLLARDGLRVVRLLPLCDTRAVLRRVVLPLGE